MIDSAHCIQRNGDPDRASRHVEAVVDDFQVLLEWLEVEASFDEPLIALEHLLAAVDLLIDVRGRSTEP